jgi:hypothetical protein
MVCILSKDHENQKETERKREDEILRRMLNTPPKPKKAKPEKKGGRTDGDGGS